MKKLAFSAFAALLLACICLSTAFASDKHVDIAAGSKIFITPMDGFENDIIAAFRQKGVPLTVVDSADKADFVMSGTSHEDKAGWAKTIFVSPSPAVHSSISIKNKTGEIVYAYEVDKMAARKGLQSAAEAIAKHLKASIEAKN